MQDANWWTGVRMKDLEDQTRPESVTSGTFRLGYCISSHPVPAMLPTKSRMRSL